MGIKCARIRRRAFLKRSRTGGNWHGSGEDHGKEGAHSGDGKRLFATRNFDVSMSAIAEEIGIPVGSIYTYLIQNRRSSRQLSKKDGTNSAPGQKMVLR
jgi:hypothetical protein